MFGMNFAYGNNFGLGGFGGFGCCCRPNPFMLGVMRGYNSAMLGYAMMGACSMPPIISLYSQPQVNQGYSYPQNSYMPQYNFNYDGNSFVSSLEELNLRNDEVSKRWQSALSKLQNPTTETTGSVSTGSSKAETEAETTASNVKGKEVKTSPDFMYKIQKIAASLNCDPNDLLSVMNAESGIDAGAENMSGQGAVGLIQFTSVAIQELNNHGYNVTKEQLKKMDPVKQLDYVEKYLQIAKSYSFSKDAKLSAGDIYAVIFLPGRANRDVLAAKGENYYDCNKGLDINKDGKITKSELSQRVDRFRVSIVA